MGEEEWKLILLCSNALITSLENSRESKIKPIQTIKEFTGVTGYKINVKKINSLHIHEH